MPSLLVASITVLPSGTSSFFPSISSSSMASSNSDVIGNQAFLVLDVVLELGAEMLDETFHGQRSGVAERADGAAGDIVGDRIQHLEVLVFAFAVLDAIDHPIQPTRAFAAGCALAAGLLEVE